MANGSTAQGTTDAKDLELLDKLAKARVELRHQIAQRIAQTKDPARKRQLVAHYNTLRALTKARAKAQNLTPDQRKLWNGVLRVLAELGLIARSAAPAASHKRVMRSPPTRAARKRAASQF